VREKQTKKKEERKEKKFKDSYRVPIDRRASVTTYRELLDRSIVLEDFGQPTACNLTQSAAKW
jgi:hypothetical protein